MRLARNRTLEPDWRLAPATADTVGHLQVLSLVPDCGDCIAQEFYIALPATWVRVSYSLEQGTPFSFDQQDTLFRRIAATLESATP
jgi:hypothetical protein